MELVSSIAAHAHREEEVLTAGGLRLALRCVLCLRVSVLRTCDHCADTYRVNHWAQRYCKRDCRRLARNERRRKKEIV